MLRAIVTNYLDAVTEREFDGPLLALLAAQGFTDVHFIHGAYEFGKDVIAKRTDPGTGSTVQYSIQSKAGDINQAGWRSVRPQLEECEYNTRAHPSFDAQLPRTVVLVTTGRLTGSAPVDAQEYKASCTVRGLADFETWDRETLADWICADPELSLAEANDPDLLAILSQIGNRTITEPTIERHTRTWLSTGWSPVRAAVEASLIGSALRASNRLDLAALSALHLLRAALSASGALAGAQAASARDLFCVYGRELLDALEPLLDNPHDLVSPLATLGAAATYPAACCRLAEIVSLLVLATENAGLSDRARRATDKLAELHPGTSRPPSDAFAASIVPVVCVIGAYDRQRASDYLRRVGQWALDRHDEDLCGLGLASLDESEEVTVERLLGGKLTSTDLQPRRSSYVLTVVLDMFVVLGDHERYTAVREQMKALRITPTMTYADESTAHWRRGGQDVWPQPVLPYGDWNSPKPPHYWTSAGALPLDALLLGAVCRSRHSVGAVMASLPARSTAWTSS